jgi:hypothetical protein
MEKHATESTRNTRGERLSQIKTHQGTWCPGERLGRQSGENPSAHSFNILYSLPPRRPEETVDGSSNAEDHGCKPERVDSISNARANILVGVL